MQKELLPKRSAFKPPLRRNARAVMRRCRRLEAAATDALLKREMQIYRRLILSGGLLSVRGLTFIQRRLDLFEMLMKKPKP